MRNRGWFNWTNMVVSLVWLSAIIFMGVVIHGYVLSRNELYAIKCEARGGKTVNVRPKNNDFMADYICLTPESTVIPIK